jgi:DNA polymerase
LELRLQYALSATKKLDAFLNHHVEGRIHDGLIYAGASQTLRWSGSGVQPQNMPRGLGAATSDVFEHVHQDGFPDEVRDDNGFLYRGKQNVIKQLIRGFITGPLLVGDFAQIEARVLAWVCRQEDMLQAFVNKEDPYKLMASKIYEKPIEDIDGSERFFGKTAVLGAGYGLGPGSFQRMLEQTYGREITDSQAADIILAYRSAAPRVVSLWEALDRAISMKKSIWLNRELNMYLDWGGKKKDRLCIHLPSGRTIWYYSLKDLYGGKLTGHMVQSIARDLMAHTLRQLDKAGFDLVLTVHDEAVAEAPESRLAEFDSVMRQVPDWAKALPVDVECFATDRYRK